MLNRRTTIEMIAPTVEEAIQKGLEELRLPREAVEVEVLDEGSRGLFGLGARQARIRLTVKEALESAEAIPPSPPSGAAVAEVRPEPVPPPEEDKYILDLVRDTVQELLTKMKVKAQVSAAFGQADDPKSRVPVLVNVQGNDLSFLIGRRAEILNALQYITFLIVSKELGRSIPIIVDVEGYRVRRENQLRRLATRMAEQAIKTGRRQVLEPMPANERRIIHLELRDHPKVRTESVGEEPNRKVTIIPKD